MMGGVSQLATGRFVPPVVRAHTVTRRRLRPDANPTAAAMDDAASSPAARLTTPAAADRPPVSLPSTAFLALLMARSARDPAAAPPGHAPDRRAAVAAYRLAAGEPEYILGPVRPVRTVA